MDPIRFGRQIRALRRRRGWRQLDLAEAARLSRTMVARVELGRVDEVTVRAANAIAAALSARLDLRLSWNGEELDRLLDADHSALVEVIAKALGNLGWQVKVEASFNIRGERGSVDVLAFHPDTRIVLVVEVKSVVPDVQATVFSIDRKSRLGVEIAREHGWRAQSAARLLVIRGTRTARRRVDRHGETFRAAFPARTIEVRQWLRSPDPLRPLSGLWFVSDVRGMNARHRIRTAVSKDRV